MRDNKHSVTCPVLKNGFFNRFHEITNAEIKIIYHQLSSNNNWTMFCPTDITSPTTKGDANTDEVY